MLLRVCWQEETGTCPLITPFGVHCLEKLGDTLLQNGAFVFPFESFVLGGFFASDLVLSTQPDEAHGLMAVQT